MDFILPRNDDRLQVIFKHWLIELESEMLPAFQIYLGFSSNDTCILETGKLCAGYAPVRIPTHSANSNGY